MNSSDRVEFSRALTACMEIYSKKVTASILDIFWKSLEKYDLSEVLNAMSVHIQDPDAGRFAPKPADLVGRFRGTGSSQALAAWTKLDEAVRCIGTYESVCFDDAIIHVVVSDMGGWPSFGEKDNSEWPFVRNEFEKRYLGYLLQGGVGSSQVPMLHGIATDRRPILIGDHKKASEIHQKLINKPRVNLTRISDIATKALSAGES